LSPNPRSTEAASGASCRTSAAPPRGPGLGADGEIGVDDLRPGGRRTTGPPEDRGPDRVQEQVAQRARRSAHHDPPGSSRRARAGHRPAARQVPGRDPRRGGRHRFEGVPCRPVRSGGLRVCPGGGLSGACAGDDLRRQGGGDAAGGDFGKYWRFHLRQEQQRVHLNRYRAGFHLAA